MADLWLVRGVGGVPARVLQDPALNHRRSEGVVVAEADHLHHGTVLGGDLPQLVYNLDLGERGGKREPLTHPDHGGDCLVDHRVEAGPTERRHHVVGLRLTRSDVSSDERHVRLEVGQGCRCRILTGEQVSISDGVGHGSASGKGGLGSPSVICT